LQKPLNYVLKFLMLILHSMKQNTEQNNVFTLQYNQIYISFMLKTNFLIFFTYSEIELKILEHYPGFQSLQ
jgi:hypothetical protein